MKQIFVKRLLIAGIALLTVPSVVIAQKEKEKEKEKEKKEMQTIVITRDANTSEKTVVEIDGDKVKINGKDARDNKDVHVNVTTIKGMNRMRYNHNGGATAWNFNMDNDGMSLFDEDENRAMLGVVTSGDDKGAEIESVNKESAAEKAGLKKGDIITKIGDKKIESTDDVTEAIHSHKPGDKVDISYLRDGKEQKATAELEKWKGIRAVTAPRVWGQGYTPPSIDITPFENFGSTFSFTGRPKLGLSIQDTDDGKGVKVLDVDDESNAAKAGLKEDDIILSIDDKEVKGTDDVTRTIRTAPKDKYTFNFKIQRDGKTQNLEVKMPRKLKTADL